MNVKDLLVFCLSKKLSFPNVFFHGIGSNINRILIHGLNGPNCNSLGPSDITQAFASKATVADLFAIARIYSCFGNAELFFVARFGVDALIPTCRKRAKGYQ
jgi:hypothetical protein